MMSSMPLIPHHLFVAAVQPAGPPEARTAAPKTPLLQNGQWAREIAVEVLDSARRVPVSTLRALTIAGALRAAGI